MNIKKMLFLSAFLVMPAFAADGPGTLPPGAKPPYGQHGAMQEACRANPEKCRQERMAKREQWCAENPEKCREMKARAEQRRADCKADPEKCRQERRAKREKWCADNPEKCKEMKARAEQRRAQCKADPAKCEQERKARMDERFKRADADGNGQLSKQEAENRSPRLARHFDRIDANKDGQLSREELAVAMEKRRAHRLHHHRGA